MVRVLQPKQYYAHEFRPAHRSNYTAGRQGAHIDRIVVHVTQGSFSSAYNWCQNSAANVSWHYLIAQNGHAAQQLSENHAGWHAGNWEFNKKSVGIEHAGYISQPGMWTEALLDSSAKIAAGIIHRAPGIPNDRFGYHLWAHSSIPGSSHTDPGRHFDWDDYMARIARFLGGEQAPTPSPAPPAKDTVYRVIAGSFGSKENADARARDLERKGFPEPWIYQHGQYFRVQAASYSDEGNADEMVQRLKAAGIEAYTLAEKA